MNTRLKGITVACVAAAVVLSLGACAVGQEQQGLDITELKARGFINPAFIRDNLPGSPVYSVGIGDNGCRIELEKTNEWGWTWANYRDIDAADLMFLASRNSRLSIARCYSKEYSGPGSSPTDLPTEESGL